jgi:NADH-quinone oxidoreductase subunit L
MPSFLEQQPGLLYVAATLLPLLSFLILLLTGTVRNWIRSTWPDSPYAAGSGLPAGKVAAYIATGAIGLAFLLSLAGFLLFQADHPGHGTHAATHEHQHDDAAKEEEKDDEHTAEAPDRWAGSMAWAWVGKGEEDERGGTTLRLGFRIDSLTAVMFLMVTFIATLIHVFSIGYMGDELQTTVEDHQVHTEGGHLHRRGRFGRFFLFMSLFCFSMLNLVLADNLFQVFLSWELVGICSYLLIGFYYERNSASTAANKAFITNRVGDAGFVIGLMILWTYVGTLNFEEMFAAVRAPVKDAHGKGLMLGGQFVRGEVSDEGKLAIDESGGDVLLFPRKPHIHAKQIESGKEVPVVSTPKAKQYGSMPYWLLVVAGLGIFLGCVGKSAQFPLHVWLPDAMEGPTPVSALIHAATMVAAGVYLVGRTYPLFTPEALLVIAYTGGITLFVAATIALVATDIKKVLAYSTVSQLGYMMLALGVGGWVAGLFHLVTHAFFKALLFLGSGSVIYGCHHEQDMRKMGGLYPKMKVTALTMLMGVLAIAGIPGFSGWYSKDSILAQAFGFTYLHPEHSLLFFLPLATAGLTTFYMFRMWFLTFTGQPKDEHVFRHAHESPRLMTVPLVVLAFFSVVVAWGWPFFATEFPFLESKASWLDAQIHHSQPAAVIADFGYDPDHDPMWEGGKVKDYEKGERNMAHEWHAFAGNLALGVVFLGFVFAFAIYYRGALNPADAMEQFPGVHRFLLYKWYFDELYSATLVRPALVVAQALRWFDLTIIDGIIHTVAWGTVRLSKWDGIFDATVIDGLVNLTAGVVYTVGGWLRAPQTGSLRSYVLFLAMAAVVIFMVLSWLFVSLAAAG